MKARFTLASIIGISLIAIGYQNCGDSPAGEGQNHTVSVVCHPSGSCLKFHLTTYDRMDCDVGQNKARVDTLSVQNAATMTEVLWDNCDKKDANSACCEQGDVVASFGTTDGFKDITIFFNNDVDYWYDFYQ